MKKFTGYDLGGAENPFNLKTHEVIDWKEGMRYYRRTFKRKDGKIRDLRTGNWSKKLEPRNEVYIGRLLSYLPNVNGELEKLDPNTLILFCEQVDSILLQYGTVSIFDFRLPLLFCMSEFVAMGYEVVYKLELVNLDEHDAMASDFSVTLRKMENK